MTFPRMSLIAVGAKWVLVCEHCHTLEVEPGSYEIARSLSDLHLQTDHGVRS